MTTSKKQEKHRNSLGGRKAHATAALRKEERTALTSDEDEQLVVFILRHGAAGTRMTDPLKDSERALTSNGRIEMHRIGKSLKDSGLEATQIVTSPLRRARETADIVAQTLKIPLLEEWDELKPDGDRESLYRKLARIERGSRVVLVGHEPYLTSMIGEIVGAPEARLILKKGGLAKVRITSFAPHVRGQLRWLLTPKMMTRMS
jgi:phosphohistidine phosphatase